MVAKEITGCYEKILGAMKLVCDQLVCMVAVYNLAPMTAQNMPENDNLIMVAMEKYWLLWIFICCQEVQIIDTLKAPSATLQNMLKIENCSVVAKEVIGCYGKILVAMLQICCQVVYLVTILRLTSVPVEYWLKN